MESASRPEKQRVPGADTCHESQESEGTVCSLSSDELSFLPPHCNNLQSTMIKTKKQFSSDSLELPKNVKDVFVESALASSSCQADRAPATNVTRVVKLRPAGKASVVATLEFESSGDKSEANGMSGNYVLYSLNYHTLPLAIIHFPRL